jgi:integrase
MAKAKLRLVTATTVLRTVTARRPKNAELRTREHLTPDEVEGLIVAAKGNRHGHRDALMVLLAFRHGLRAAEVADLRWEQVDFKTATLHVRRVKNGAPATHPLTGRELRELRRHKRESDRAGGYCSQAWHQGACSHAAPRYRLQACERWSRHPVAPGLPWPPKHPEYHSVHGAGPGSVQGLLAGLVLSRDLGAAKAAGGPWQTG